MSPASPPHSPEALQSQTVLPDEQGLIDAGGGGDAGGGDGDGDGLHEAELAVLQDDVGVLNSELLIQAQAEEDQDRRAAAEEAQAEHEDALDGDDGDEDEIAPLGVIPQDDEDQKLQQQPPHRMLPVPRAEAVSEEERAAILGLRNTRPGLQQQSTGKKEPPVPCCSQCGLRLLPGRPRTPPVYGSNGDTYFIGERCVRCLDQLECWVIVLRRCVAPRCCESLCPCFLLTRSLDCSRFHL